MTVSTTSNTAVCQGNGIATSFSFPFIIPAASQLVVTYQNASGVQTVISPTQYTVTGIGDSNGGSVTYPISGSPIATGTQLILQRITPLQQLASLVNQSGFYPDVLEDALDNLEMQIQQNAEAISRAVQVPVGSSTTPDDLINQLTTDAANAATNASNAASSASAASASQTAAASSQTAAASSASSASASQTAAAASASAASNSQTSAASSATAAASSASTASGAATSATNSATSASSSASTATTQASNASSSASAAAASASGAASSATSAAASAAAAATFNPALYQGKRIGELWDFTGLLSNMPAGNIQAPTAPTNVSRTTYAALFNAITIQVTGNTTNGNTTISNLSADVTASVVAGMPISGPGIPAGATVSSLTSTTIVLSAAATATASGVAVVIAPWGVGDGSTTFGCPYAPIDYATVNNPTSATKTTVGQVISHNHGTSISNTISGGGGANLVNAGTATVSLSTGGPANLAAGIRVIKCLQVS